MKNLKKIVLLGVMLVNMMPYLKDGNIEWKATQAEAQYYTIEEYGYNYLCGNYSNPYDEFESSIKCEKIPGICSCFYCKAQMECNTTCDNSDCPLNKSGFKLCICCTWVLDIFDDCINENCLCSKYNPYNPNYVSPQASAEGGGGGQASGASGTTSTGSGGTSSYSSSTTLSSRISAITSDAKQKPGNDMRTYGSSSPKVDCSMLQSELLKKQGYDMPRGSAAEQIVWYQTNHIWITEFSNIQVGDQLFWLRKVEGGVNYYHTGRCVGLNPVQVVHSTSNGGLPGSIKNNRTNANGEMWDQPFVGAGRLKK